jgi:hypothetical protein
MSGDQLVQLARAGQPVTDPASRQHPAVLVEQAQLMVVLAPVDSQKPHPGPPLLRQLGYEPEKDPRRLMAVLTRHDIPPAVRLLNTGRGTVSPRAQRLRSLRVLTGWCSAAASHRRLVQPL